MVVPCPEVMTLLSKCMTLGVHVYSINDRYLLDDSLNTEVVSTTCNLVSEIEHNLMSVRTKEALNHKKEKEGLQLGRPERNGCRQSLLDANKDEVMNMLERGGHCCHDLQAFQRVQKYLLPVQKGMRI